MACDFVGDPVTGEPWCIGAARGWEHRHFGEDGHDYGSTGYVSCPGCGLIWWDPEWEVG